MQKKVIALILILSMIMSISAYALGDTLLQVEDTILQLEALREVKGTSSKTLLTRLSEGLVQLNEKINEVESIDHLKELLVRAEGTLKGLPTEIEEVVKAKESIELVKANINTDTTDIDTTDIDSNLSDIGNHWGKSYITKLTARGGISGYPDGTFKPNQNISVAEFVTIAVRSALDGNVESQIGDHWASGVFDSARAEKVLLLNDFPESEWDRPINRYEMAYVMVRAAENILQEGKVGTSEVAKIMSDYEEVSKQREYKYYVEQAFMKGLVTGKTADGKYDGSANGTRAEAATMVVRMLEEKERQEVDTDKQVDTGEGREISLLDPYRPEVPKPGDIVTKADGTKIKLEVGPAGVLGEGQPVDYYTGITFPNGHVFTDDDLGVKSMGYMGQPLITDERTGEAHFREDWDKIRGYYTLKAFELYGHTKPIGFTYKNFVQYDGMGWHFLGPHTGSGGTSGN